MRRIIHWMPLLFLSLSAQAQFNLFHGIVNQCVPGMHKENSLCTSNTRSCAIANGSGSQVWNGTSYNSCVVTSCNSGYEVSGSSCILSDPCASASPSRGAKCANGTIYVGSFNGKKYYTHTLAAASAAGYGTMFNGDDFSWGRNRSSSCANNSLYSGTGYPPNDGLLVSNNYAACRSSTPASGWPGAMDVCTDAGFHGKSDWFLPTRNEYYSLFFGQNSSAITASGAGGFGGEYWVADLESSSGWYASPTGFRAMTIVYDWFWHYYTQRWFAFCIRHD